MLTTTASYRLLAADMTKSLQRTAAAPTVQRESDYYLSRIGDIKSIDDFIGDSRVFAYAMKAFGLGDMTYAKAFMRKALEGGIDDPDSFANSLSDSRYRDFVTAFNFERYGEAATAFERTQKGTVDKYVRQTLEENAGASNEGVRLALYFERKAASIDSVYNILADPALLTVVQTALGIPAETSAQDIDRQADMLAARLDLDDLQDGGKLSKFLSRFTSLWELNVTPAVADPVVSLITGQTVNAGFGTELLLSLQKLKLGGS